MSENSIIVKKSHVIWNQHPCIPALSQTVKCKSGLANWIGCRGRGGAEWKERFVSNRSSIRLSQIRSGAATSKDGSLCTKAALNERQQADPLKSPSRAHTASTYPVPSVRSAKEHLGGIQTIKAPVLGHAGPRQSYHSGEDVQHTAGRTRQHWPSYSQTLPLWLRPTQASPH